MQPANLTSVAPLPPPPAVVARRVARRRLVWSGRRIDVPRAGIVDIGLGSKAVYLASFQVLIHRFQSQDEIAILVLVSSGKQPVPGTVTVSRVNLRDDPEIHALMRKSASAFDCSSTAFENTTKPSDSGESIIHGAFVYYLEDGPHASHFDIDSLALDNVDLALIVQDSHAGVQIGFEYNPDRSSPELIQELADSYQALLDSIAENPCRPISRLNLLTPVQRQRLLVDFNATDVAFPRERSPEQIFDDRAARSPDRIALRYQGRSMTYGELRTRSNQLARHLRNLGIGPGRLVALCTDRSFDMVLGLLGILKAGAAYVPLDPAYPPDRLSYMFSDAQCTALVTQSGLAPLPGVTVPVIRLDADRADIETQSGEDLEPSAGPEDLAYVIYTSGSTGRPKGVAIRRIALASLLNAMQRRLGINDHDVQLALTTISFDMGELELLLPLVTGGRVVLATREDAGDPYRLASLVEEEKVTVMQATPATWRMMLDAGWSGREHLRILCGGEAMTRDLADRLLGKGAGLWNMYGPTETTIWSTMCRIGRGTDTISIGRPIDNTEIYILDPHLQPVPIGAIGELHIGGIGLAREYLHRPELTAEKFIAHPFKSDPGARLYKTGDLARYWPDGRIECLGRVDHQVKIRGFRIELTEIEACLLAHPAIKEAAVTTQSDGAGEKYLAGYYVPRESAQEVSGSDLRKALREVLPPHMVPSVLVRMSALPLTPNGKVDRRALPVPEREACEQTETYVAPRNAIERRLVEICENLLGVRPIGVRDDFFAVGGHSLAAAQLVARIESALGVRIPIAALVSTSTMEGLAKLVSKHVQPASRIIIPLRETGSRPPLFVVAGGHVLVFRGLADLLGEDQPVYGIQGIGLDGMETPLERMEAIAARYIREILAIQPRGPWLIAGWSMGGVIAFEIARQMVAQGRRPAAIIIIDAYAPWVISWRERLSLHLIAFWQQPWRGKLEYLGRRLTNRLTHLRQNLGMLAPPEDLEGPWAQWIHASGLAQAKALRRFRPQPLPADIFLLRAEQPSELWEPRSRDLYLGWRPLVQGRIDILHVPGTHTDIFVGDNLPALAAAVRQCLPSTAPDAADQPVSAYT